MKIKKKTNSINNNQPNIMSCCISWFKPLRIDGIWNSLVEFVFVLEGWIPVQLNFFVHIWGLIPCLLKVLSIDNCCWAFGIPIEANDGRYELQDLSTGFWRNLTFFSPLKKNSMMSIGVTQWVTLVGYSYGGKERNYVKEFL